MTGLCIESSNGEYKFTFSGEEPEIGMSYLLESAIDGTLAQNALFHALIDVYYKSKKHSYGDIPKFEFRRQIKRQLGQGFDSYRYFTVVPVDGRWLPKRHSVKKYEDIPREILEDKHMKDLVLGNLKSWGKYTKVQRMKTINNVIDEMLTVGIKTKEFEAILKGINYELL